MPATPRDALIAWEGDSKEVISWFPDKAKQNLGFQLRLLQQGRQPTDYRPMNTVGPGVFELRDQDERTWYRVIYLSRIRDVVHVLHCFEKEERRNTHERNQYGETAAEGGPGTNDPGGETWQAGTIDQLTSLGATCSMTWDSHRNRPLP